MSPFPETPRRTLPPPQARLVPTLTEVVSPGLLSSAATPQPNSAELAENMERRLLSALEKDLDSRIREAVYTALGMHLPALVAQLQSQVLDAVSQTVRDSVAREMARVPDSARKHP